MFSRLNYFILFVLSLGLVSCKVEPPANAAPDLRQSFVVEEARLIRSVKESVNETWSTERKMQFFVVLCVKETQTLRPLIGLELSASTPSGKTRAITDERGCASFEQSIAYSLLEDEEFIAWPLELESLYAFQSTVSLPLAFDPWNRELLDRRYSDFEISKQNFPAENTRPSHLLLDGLSISSVTEEHDSEGVSARLLVEADAFFRSISRSGELVRHELRSAELDLEIQVHELTSQGKRYAIGGLKSDKAKVRDAKLVHQAQVRFNRMPHPGSDLEWFLILRSGHLKRDFTARFLTKGLTPSGKYILEESEIPSVSEPVSDEEAGSLIQSGKYRSQSFGFQFEALPKLTSIIRENDFSRGVSKAFVNYSFCLRSFGSSELVGNHPVEIALVENVSDLESVQWFKTVTDSKGCSHGLLPEGIAFRYFSAEEYLEKIFVVRSTESPFEGITNGTRFYINPWKLDRWFAIDATNNKRPVNPKKQAAGVKLPSGGCIYPDQNHDLEVDRELNLTFKEFFMCAFDAAVIRPFSFGSEGDAQRNEALPAGTRVKVRALLTGAMVPPSIGLGSEVEEQMRLISVFETEVDTTAFGDRLNRLEFPVAIAHDFSEKRLFYSFTRIYLEVSPLDGSDLRPITVWAPFEPFDKDINKTLALYESPKGLDELISQLMPEEHFEFVSMRPSQNNLKRMGRVSDGDTRLYKPRRKPELTENGSALTPYKRFRRDVNDLPTDIQEFDLDRNAWPKNIVPGMRQRMENLLEKPTDYLSAKKSDFSVDMRFHVLMRPLCGTYYREGSEKFKACEAKPLEHLSISLLEFVEGIYPPGSDTPASRGAVRWIKSDTTNIQVRMRIFKEIIETTRSHSGTQSAETAARGHSGTTGVSFFGSGGGLNRSYTYGVQNYSGTEFARTRDVRARFETMELKFLKSYSAHIAMDLDLKNCLLIRPGEKHRIDEPGESFLICKDSRKKIHDSWHSVIGSPEKEGQRILEQMDPENRFLKLIRGGYVFENFLRMAADGTRSLVLEKVPDFEFGPTHLLNAIYSNAHGPFGSYQDGGIFPGVSRYRNIPGDEYLSGGSN